MEGRGVRLTLSRREADVGLEELAPAGGVLNAVGKRLADLLDAQVEQLRHRERTHHHLGGSTGTRCLPDWAGRLRARPPAPPAPAVRARVRTYVRRDVRPHGRRAAVGARDVTDMQIEAEVSGPGAGPFNGRRRERA